MPTLREQRGLSLNELARKAGLSKQTLPNMEQSGGNPTVETLFSVATALGVPVSRLVAEQEQVMTVQRGGEVVWQQAAGSTNSSPRRRTWTAGCQVSAPRVRFDTLTLRYTEQLSRGVDQLVAAFEG
jgi:transcriptional regulator with XRE-family HTH domain